MSRLQDWPDEGLAGRAAGAAEQFHLRLSTVPTGVSELGRFIGKRSESKCYFEQLYRRRSGEPTFATSSNLPEQAARQWTPTTPIVRAATYRQEPTRSVSV